MQSIADAAGINKAMLHYYFRRKDDLYGSVFEHTMRRFMMSFGASLKEAPTFQKTLRAFIEGYVSFVQKNEHVMRLMVTENLAGGTLMAEHVQHMKMKDGAPPQVMVERIRVAVEDGDIRSVDPDHTLLSIVSMCIFFSRCARRWSSSIRMPRTGMRSSRSALTRSSTLFTAVWSHASNLQRATRRIRQTAFLVSISSPDDSFSALFRSVRLASGCGRGTHALGLFDDAVDAAAGGRSHSARALRRLHRHPPSPRCGRGHIAGGNHAVVDQPERSCPRSACRLGARGQPGPRRCTRSPQRTPGTIPNRSRPTCPQRDGLWHRQSAIPTPQHRTRRHLRRWARRQGSDEVQRVSRLKRTQRPSASATNSTSGDGSGANETLL